MRADRLLSILLFLQTRGKTTTARLAREFEVSRRTILRDVYALRVAGFPIDTESGPHGGCSLQEGFRTTLTRLKTDEIAALLVSSIQRPLEELGLSDPLRAARLKLSATARGREPIERHPLSTRILIDSAPWAGRAETAGCLATLYRAVMEDRWVRVVFERPFGVLTEQRIAPYGLVAKAGAWFIVWADDRQRLRFDRASRIREATPEVERFVRPDGFRLEASWDAWRERQERAQPTFDVVLRVRADALDSVRQALRRGSGVIVATADEADGWVEMEAAFSYFEEARRRLLPLGGAVEVLRPRALRASIADVARQISLRYPEPAES